MKWGIIILVILGLVAAACAALLVSTMGASPSDAKNSSAVFEVAMAKRTLPAMTVITLDHVVKETVTKNDLPQGQRLASPTRVIGRILAVPVVEGQVLTESCFVTEGTGAQLAAALPHGMRAVTVAVSSKAMPDSILLYPGCVVDVLVAYRLSSRSSEGQALSTTMLRGVQVLAVSGESVVSNPDEEEKSSTRTRPTSRSVTVTLMVDTKQAEALQLAVENGNITLSIRNPLDREMFELEGTVLSQGRLAHLGSVLTPTVLAAAQKELEGANNPQEQAQGGSALDTNNLAQQPKSGERSQVNRYPRWGVTVIRGRDSKLEELAITEGEAVAGADAKK